MDTVNKFLDWGMAKVNQLFGWFGSFFNAVVPSANDADSKAKFIKVGLIVAGLIVAAKVLRLNLSTGGRKR